MIVRIVADAVVGRGRLFQGGELVDSGLLGEFYDALVQAGAVAPLAPDAPSALVCAAALDETADASITLV